MCDPFFPFFLFPGHPSLVGFISFVTVLWQYEHLHLLLAIFILRFLIRILTISLIRYNFLPPLFSLSFSHLGRWFCPNGLPGQVPDILGGPHGGFPSTVLLFPPLVIPQHLHTGCQIICANGITPFPHSVTVNAIF